MNPSKGGRARFRQKGGHWIGIHDECMGSRSGDLDHRG